MGALVGDALGMGMQWYYNLSEKEEQCGEWVTEFLDPNPGRSDFFGNISKHRYDHGMRAGDTTQLGQIFAMLLDAAAVSGKGGFKADFCAKLDDLFATLSGESLSGRYSTLTSCTSKPDRHDWTGKNGETARLRTRPLRTAPCFLWCLLRCTLIRWS